jgi:succinyl-diaminopimelate desuccinylase
MGRCIIHLAKEEINMKQATAVELTKELVGIDSTNPGAYEKDIKAYIESWLRPLPNVRITEAEVQSGRYNLMAELPYKNDIMEYVPALIFICHMDTVVVGDGWLMSPFAAAEYDQKIYGRGACDMKSGLACCMSAFAHAAHLIENGQIAKRPLKLICTMDEEDFMLGSEHCIKSGWVTKDDWILDAEPTSKQIQVAHKGRTWYEIEVTGLTAHASTPWKGADAIAAMAEIIREIRLAIQASPPHPDLGISTVTFGQIEGGYRPYVVPDSCKLWVDMRLVPPLNTQKTMEIVESAIARAKEAVPGINVDYTITGDRPYIEKDDSAPLLAAVKDACVKVTKKMPEVTCFPGYTDTAVIAGRLGNKNCLSYGPGDLECAHKPDEWVKIHAIERCEKVFCELIKVIF